MWLVATVLDRTAVTYMTHSARLVLCSITYHSYNNTKKIICILQRKLSPRKMRKPAYGLPARHVTGSGLASPGQVNPKPTMLCCKDEVSFHHRRA
jgi:hypothetical protein